MVNEGRAHDYRSDAESNSETMVDHDYFHDSYTNNNININLPHDLEKSVQTPPIYNPSPNPPTTTPTPPQFSSPFDFPLHRKWLITTLLALLTFTSTFCSSIFSATITATASEFHTSEEIMLLGVSLFVLGYALGPLLWGPLSELVGRKPTIFSAYAVFAVMQVPTALSPSLPGVLVCRLIAGCCGAAPVAVVSAVFADFWTPSERGTATGLYSAAVFAGPMLGPLVGSFVTQSRLGWRWTAWLVLIMAGCVGVPCFLVVPETYAPVLREKAARKQGVEGGRKNPFEGFVKKYLARPVLMLIYEPMLDVITLYMSLVYSIMYLTFYAFPYTFTQRGWPRTTTTLPFLSMLLGILTSCLLVSLYSTKYYQPRLKARNGHVVPEDRLPLVMVGSVLLPIGLFWFAWTSSPSISPVPQIISAFFIGSGIMLIFTNGLVYIVDIYGSGSASAVAANAFVRSIAAAGLPLAAPRMYRVLGTEWATSVLGIVCVVLVPAPFVFYRCGARIRRVSRFAERKG